MKDIYHIRKDSLKLLYKEEIILSFEFQSFTINHSTNIERMSSDIMPKALVSVDVDVKYDIGSPSTTTRIIDHHQYRSLACEWVVGIIFLWYIIAQFFH